LFGESAKQRAALLLAVCLSVAPLPGRTVVSVCGHDRLGARVEIALARKAAQRRALLLNAQPREAAGLARDIGQIATLDGSGGVISPRNPFDLGSNTLTLTPVEPDASAYSYTLSAPAYDPSILAGSRLLALADDDFAAIDLPFEFPFFGARYRSLFVHSDGNVTFQEPDAASAERSLGRLAAGPPRIGPLFADLDPSQPGAEVRLSLSADSCTFTWVNVPQWSEYGYGARQTFQLVLSSGGAIQFRYQAVSLNETVVGISPGRLTGDAEVVSFSGSSTTSYRSTLAERFTASLSLDTTRAAQRFYETHEDSYDYLVFFNSAGIPTGPSVLANETTVRSRTQGIGDTSVDFGAQYGSPRRLQAVLNMGPLWQYPLDPYSTVGTRGLVTGDNTMTLLGHEAGHLFLALASVRDPSDPNARPMLGAARVHWSFNFNSEASLLEGNRIADLGSGMANRFLTTGTVEGYSALDQYLMGFRLPEEVPPTFVVWPSNIDATSFPRVGVAFRGGRWDVSISDLIAAEGRRVPDSTVAQRRFRFGFVLITDTGQQATDASVRQLETYRQEFETYFKRVSGDRAVAETSLLRSIRTPAWPAFGLLSGKSADVAVDSPPPELAVTTSGSVLAAGPVTAGALQVMGRDPGVADLWLTAGESYESLLIRVAVRASASELHLVRHFRQGRTAVLRIADDNELPYPGVRVFVDGRSNPIPADASGLVWIDAAPDEILTATIEDAPGSRIRW
jgi:hypothetical protein